ncbi:MAG: hypothetical protein ACD_20C00311G0005 [uncultured bacterium]|nr:MAG: hypothetical protein ACD_20C00311G0005 [uncultured bacterium]HBH17884.1 hypothetical protein [Cyanobacteria bacterium UBA9579]
MKFNILQKILPPEDKIFYSYFEESANVCREAAILFNDIMHQGLNEDRLIEAKRLKHKSNDLAKQTLCQLNATFITPIDREDIQHVAALLNKITKKIVKACVNLRVYRLDIHNDNMKKQAETLVKATDELIYIVSHLKKVCQIAQITESNYRMKEIETHGDEILYKAMDELFCGDCDALTVIKLRDIYKDIENALDTCFSVSDTVVHIVLKHG